MFLVISYRNVLTEVFGRMWLAGVKAFKAAAEAREMTRFKDGGI
jgi:hypothetical protein